MKSVGVEENDRVWMLRGLRRTRGKREDWREDRVLEVTRLMVAVVRLWASWAASLVYILAQRMTWWSTSKSQSMIDYPYTCCPGLVTEQDKAEIPILRR